MRPDGKRMNAMSLYLSTSRCAMQAQPKDPDSWTELHRLLPLTRQALSCCVCTNILKNPMGPPTTVCQHHVCKDCLGGKMRLKPACGWCNEFDTFEEKPVLKVTVECFRKLCEYLANSPLAETFGNTANGGANNILSVIQNVLSSDPDHGSGGSPLLLNTNTLLSGAVRSPGRSATATRTRPRRTSHGSDSDVNVSSGQSEVRSEVTTHKVDANTQTGRLETDLDPPTLEPVSEQIHSQNVSINSDLEADRTAPRHEEDEVELVQIDCTDVGRKLDLKTSASTDFDSDVTRTLAAEHDYHKDNNSLYSVTLMNDVNPKLKIRRTPPSEYPESGESSASNSPKKSKSAEKASNKKRSPDTKSKGSKSTKTPKVDKEDPESKASKLIKKEKPTTGCRCGTATANPGKLTCCGQRCPCYSSYKGCTDCRCRGCRNPRIDGMTPPPHILLQQQSILQLQICKTGEEDEEEIDVDV